MKLGISTASLYPLETEKALEILGENGVKVTEIFFNSICELEDEFIDKLNAIRIKYGIEVHSLHPCGSLGEPYFLFSGYERRYNESREFYKKYYKAAKKLGAKVIVLHGDSLAGHISFEEYVKRLYEMNLDAKSYGVTVSHENVNRYRLATPENVNTVKSLSGGQQKFTFDIKQSVRAGCGVEEMYNAMKGSIVNVHISDHSDSKDCLLPGRGNFDFKSFFEKLYKDRYDGPVLIEVYDNAYKSYDELFETLENVKNITKNY